VVPIALKLLGGFEVAVGAGAPARIPTRKAQALLAYLAMTAGRPVARDAIAALLWSGAAESAARNNLRQTLFVLRKSLGPAAASLDVAQTTVRLSARASTSSSSSATSAMASPSGWPAPSPAIAARSSTA